MLGVLLVFAHRALCARAIRRRAVSETVRLPLVLVLVLYVLLWVCSRQFRSRMREPQSLRQDGHVLPVVL